MSISPNGSAHSPNDTFWWRRNAFSSMLTKELSSLDSQESIAELIRFGIYIRPAKLFRYRRCGKHSFEDLENGTVCFSSARTFSKADPLDCSLGLPDKPSDIEMIAVQKSMCQFETLSNMSNKKVGDVFGNVQAILPQVKDMTFGECIGTGSDLKANLSNTGTIIGKLLNQCNDGIERLFKTTKILCTTGRDDNAYMWSNFADSERGFVLEYSTQDLLSIGNEINMAPTSMPIIYRDKESDFGMLPALFLILNTQVEDDAIKSYTMLTFIKLIFTKGVSFSDEEEWRVFSYVLEGEREDDHILRPCKARAVILGRNMSPENRERAITAARRNGIKVREQPDELK